jgi:hypothetical protein
MTATRAGIVAMLEWVWLGLRGWSSVPYVMGNYVLAEAVFLTYWARWEVAEQT